MGGAPPLPGVRTPGYMNAAPDGAPSEEILATVLMEKVPSLRHKGKSRNLDRVTVNVGPDLFAQS
jgi:hypothetical protein